MTEKEFVAFMGPLAHADMQKSGILASVTTAQGILESGYGSTDLAKNANNFFGMKCVLSGNTWPGSTWDGVSKYTKSTGEQKPDGTPYTVVADFRKYPSAAESVADHSAYLLGAMNGSKKRYAGLAGEKDPAKAIAIIKAGGYATDVSYVSKILSIIERFDLTQYDAVEGSAGSEEKVKIVQSILTKNPCYTGGRKLDNGVKGLMLHSVGCPQPKASVFINSWNSPSYGNACVHGFIDALTGTVYQTLPWNWRGWHCASGSKGSGNNTHIGVEMCEPDCIKYTSGSSFTCSDKARAKEMVKRTYEAAVQLFAMLCKQYGLNPLADGVVISHAEGYKRGIASNHGDPEHLWKGLGMGYTMDGFRKDVKAAMSGVGTSGGSTPAPAPAEEKKYYRVRKSWADAASQKGAYEVLANAKKEADKNPGYKVYDWNGKQVYPVAAFKPYTVKVSIDDLNIRKKPDSGSGSHGFTGEGIFTIVAEAEGPGATLWGLLKSYADEKNGWISLDYAKFVAYV